MEEEERIDGIISERGEIAEPPQFPAPVMRNVEYPKSLGMPDILHFWHFQLAHVSYLSLNTLPFHVSFIRPEQSTSKVNVI